jgi:UDP-2,3-diacylglucosamine pyrophosphatase LpxH
MSNQGTKVVYITGNHDEALRKYSDTNLGNIELVDKLILELDEKKIWIFHGDVFDSSTRGYAKIIAKLGGKGYDLLILINTFLNWLLVLVGKEKRSFSKKIKDSVKKALAIISHFETTAAEIAIEKKYDYVICGHIHQPNIKTYENAKGKVIYLNSGDWIENLTSLEYHQGEWVIYKHDATEHEVVDVKAMSEEVSIFELFKQSHSSEELVFLSKIIAHSKTAAI